MISFFLCLIFIILMNLQQSFTCPVCLQLAKGAVETECCAKIYCQGCIQDIQIRFSECPCCRNRPLAWHPSRIARKVISEIKVPCPSCELKVESGALQEHLAKCPKVPLQCKICKETMLQEAIPKHTANMHQKQAKEYLISYALGLKQQPGSKAKNKDKIPPPNNSDPNSLFQQVINRFGLKASLGNTSKYFCGGKVEGRCGCCNGSCGPDNGENCNACMYLDIKRWRLRKGCLINTAGYPCRVIPLPDIQKYGVCCFRVLQEGTVTLFGPKQPAVCDVRKPCTNCEQMVYSINNLGRYKGLY